MPTKLCYREAIKIGPGRASLSAVIEVISGDTSDFDVFSLQLSIEM
jgi:hypothetical protein